MEVSRNTQPGDIRSKKEIQKRKFKNIKEAKEALRTKHEGERIVFIGEYRGEDLKKHEPRDSKRVIPRG